MHQNPGARNRVVNLLSFSLPLCLVLLWTPGISLAATGPRDDSALDGRPAQAEGTGEDHSSTQGKDRPDLRIKDLPRLILRDQKFLWLRPFQLKRADLPWAGVVAGTTAGLIAGDRHAAEEILERPPGSGFAFVRRVGQAGGPLTDAGVSGIFYWLGQWRGDDRARTTGLLGWEALADSLLITQALKVATQRPRPSTDDGRLPNHHGDGQFFSGGSSFPSGHAVGAFALATVTAQQYRDHPWVPPLAYGLAGLVSVSRVSERQHFPSDIFVGGVLGYLVGRHIFHEAETRPADNARHWHVLPYVPPSGGAAVLFTWDF
ncbi:MAG: phosphatase PAP2 family protein [Acidobacteriia bacterium]|nr:phosphatase PAP2 family protein [Terriglobia bacterium]